LYNLLSNAVKFTPPNGSIVVQACQADVDEVRNSLGRSTGGGAKQECGFIRIDVRDTGIGIGNGQERRIFLPFGQVEDSESRKFHGLGLGLTLSTKLAQLHGGAIQLQSGGKGKGSTFSFIFPCDRKVVPSSDSG
jgi:signal transduction histidine kinase